MIKGIGGRKKGRKVKRRTGWATYGRNDWLIIGSILAFMGFAVMGGLFREESPGGQALVQVTSLMVTPTPYVVIVTPAVATGATEPAGSLLWLPNVAVGMAVETPVVVVEMAAAAVVATPVPTETPVPTVTATETPVPSATWTPTVLPTATQLPTQTPTWTPISTSTPIVLPTATEPAVSQTSPNAFQCIGGCAEPTTGCAIKGNVNSSGERIYHTPSSRYYTRTDIKPEEGDRWFCTEAEAREAGFRAPDQ